uniref:Putative secreted protein n=1 Tax=Lutzomyia longipalpis TaxID=7200 RepID=A0A7G3APY3_LUTLO
MFAKGRKVERCWLVSDGVSLLHLLLFAQTLGLVREASTRHKIRYPYTQTDWCKCTLKEMLRSGEEWKVVEIFVQHLGGPAKRACTMFPSIHCTSFHCVSLLTVVPGQCTYTECFC